MKNKVKNICWSVALFLILNPICTLLLLTWFALTQTWPSLDVALGLVTFSIAFGFITNLSITMGYHRLFAHKSYEAHPLLQVFLLLIGAGGFQGSALKWASDHRVHHKFEDTDKDPYSINKGFWYAHMGWMMRHESVSLPIEAPDLMKNKWVKIQHDYYLFWAIGVGYIFPLLIGVSLGEPLLGLILGGGLRIFLTQQSTFLVNSLSHTLGRTPYSTSQTAKDSFIVTLLTHGEGYHNFHHKFQFDYRNGIRWYHWDPTKWSIQIASLIGLAKSLKQVRFSEILRARLQVEIEKVKVPQVLQTQVSDLQNKIIQTQIRIEDMTKHYKLQGAVRAEQMRVDLKIAKIELERYLKTWRVYLKNVNKYA
jgi:stearoyl-CoA desaturase (Delta-9 desaturase)